MFGLPLNYKGVLIEDVVQNGPADKAGLKGMLIQGNRFGEQQILDKDIVIAIDSNPVSRIDDIISYLDINKKVGDKVNLTVNRNGQTINLIATLEARPNLPLQEIQSQSEPNNDDPSHIPRSQISNCHRFQNLNFQICLILTSQAYDIGVK